MIILFANASYKLWEFSNMELTEFPMQLNMTPERRQAHALLDLLPDDKLTAVRSLLEVMLEPLARSLALAPIEEEEITPETAQALNHAKASLARGEGLSHEEMQREFGISSQ